MPRRIRLVALAPCVASPLPQQIHSVCVACGGRNLVHFGKRSQLVQCRSCGVVSPDFNQRKAPSCYVAEEVEPLSTNQAQALLDEMLDALSHETVKRKLQALQKQALGDVPLLCHFYVPAVVDVCAMVASKHGFSASMEGVKECIRVMQRVATTEDDGQMTTKLIQLRKVLTPTGAWINEDAQADAADLQKKMDELERQRQTQQEAQRMEEIAAENARKARLRAKKIALGLDPSVPRPPRLDMEPPRVVVAHADARVQLRVVVRYALRFQWFCNGKPLSEESGDAAMHVGAQRSTLTLRRLTKRFVGEYYCVCTNEEGAVSSQSTRVNIMTEMDSLRLASRKLKTIPSGGGVVPLPFGRYGRPVSAGTQPVPAPSLVAVCVDGALLLLHAKTLAPAKTTPPLTLPMGSAATAVAWQASAKLLAVVLSSRMAPPALTGITHSHELRMYAIDTPTVPLPASLASSSPKPTKHGPKAANSPPPPPPQVFLLRHLSTHAIPGRLRRIDTIRFLDGGNTVLVSDLHAALIVYELTPTSLVCKLSLHYDDPQRPLRHIATTRATASGSPPLAGSFTGIAVCRRNCTSVELIATVKGRPSSAISFKLPVHRMAFDRDGFTLAIAESGCLKTWVSIVSVTVTDSKPQSSRRFVAHVGKISGMQWTCQSSLLATSGYDGYIKIWDVEHGTDHPACVFQVHLDFRGVQSFALLEEIDPVAWVAVAFSDCRLHVRELPQLRAFEANRCIDLDHAASQIQKIFKGKHTRELIDKFIRG